ncbi:Histidine kinase-, DNA gyrase B-, and HSP90-like ATPase [Butyrivibrio fibrisolvens]|uniref:Histidine kinase-, DNA gyrase B-, and HSP90-like ATPase n=1 Tax=Butyrivibrio fibrisolvens TaxID=831 RepID=A0A1H9XAN8_BUTFI|nr:ATP-binding protein [Butyrivibrio fibrisolvens]SES43184.1 Histidine kinase-, DNA gyrase B-, and HSP90-like ATPase [Butyrivibrio fibrisolvens]
MGFQENIKAYCENNISYSHYLTRFDSAIIETRNRLKTIPFYFRHFSRHDETHSELIIQYLEMLIGEKCIGYLSVSDQVILVLAAYSHDVGMALEHDQIEELFKSPDYADKLRNSIPAGYKDLDKIVDEMLQFPKSVESFDKPDVLKLYSDVSIVIENFFRKGHADRSAQFISTHADIFGFLGIRGAKLLAKICASHDMSIERIMDFPFEENGFFGDYLHPRFLAGMLCLGDLLDLDTDRFDEAILRASSKMPILSLLHKRKHESIEHYLVKDGIIKIWADCSDDNVYHTLCEWTGWIKDACSFLVINWDEITPDERILPPRLKENKILIGGNDKWVGYADSKIHIDVDKAVKLFEGANLYKGKHTFIRELIQNAIDATLIQLCDDANGLINKKNLATEDILGLINDKRLLLDNYSITGRFYAVDEDSQENIDSEDEKTVIFEIEDHGTGISKSELDSIIGLKGKSSALIEKMAYMPVFFKPAGAFGIGLQSVFQVASKVIFITKTDDEKAKKITMMDPSSTGAVYVEDYKRRMHRGTKVMVYMDPGKFTQTDFGCSDYIYQTTAIHKMILTWLFQHAYNLGKEEAPGFEARRQTEDYFDTKISGFLGDEDNEREVLVRKSILSDMASNYSNDHAITINNGYFEYKYYDLEKNCIFTANFLSDLDEEIKDKTSDKAEKDNSGGISFGRCKDWHNYKYGHNIFYRNVLAQGDFLHDRWEENTKIGRLVDFKINLFSDDADKILNVGRNQISENYHDTMVKLVEHEIAIMFKKMIDYCIDNQSISNRILFLAFVQSNILEYKTDILYEKKKDIIDKMSVNNYYNIEGEEISIPLNKFFDSKLILLKKLSDEESKNLPECVWNEKIIENSERVCTYDISKIKNSDEHIIEHYLVGEYYVEYNSVKYLAYEVIPYRLKGNVKAALRSDFIRYREFLYVILNDIRCVLASKGYEILETPLSGGIIGSHRGNSNNAVEMMLDSNIKEKLSMMLRMHGYVPEANRFIIEIIASEKYKKNIDFIKKYHERMGHDIDESNIKNSYKSFLSGLLLLLEKIDYKEYLQNNLSAFTMDIVRGGWTHSEFDYFSRYHIRRFCKEAMIIEGK